MNTWVLVLDRLRWWPGYVEEQDDRCDSDGVVVEAEGLAVHPEGVQHCKVPVNSQLYCKVHVYSAVHYKVPVSNKMYYEIPVYSSANYKIPVYIVVHCKAPIDD